MTIVIECIVHKLCHEEQLCYELLMTANRLCVAQNDKLRMDYGSNYWKWQNTFKRQTSELHLQTLLHSNIILYAISWLQIPSK